MKAHLGLELTFAPIRQQSTAHELTTVQELRAAQECSLCKQEISAKRQASLNLILIEKYDFCPSCCQRVRKEIASSSWYRRRWKQRVRTISKKNGWGWESNPKG